MIKEIANHRSIRKYKSSPIDEEVLSDILHSAARASTCGNMQLYSLVVTLDAQQVQKPVPAERTIARTTSRKVASTPAPRVIAKSSKGPTMVREICPETRAKLLRT